MLDLEKELAAAKKAAKKKKPAKKKAKAKKAAPKTKKASVPSAAPSEHEGDVSASRKPAMKETEKVGGWTLHADENSGGVAAVKGKTVHVFTGRMAKASAVAFAKNHAEGTTAKRSAKAAKEELSPEHADLAKGIIDALKAASKSRPKFEHVTSDNKDQKKEIHERNQKLIEEYRTSKLIPIQEAINKAEKAKVPASFWTTIAKDKDFFMTGVKSGKSAKTKIASLIKRAEFDASRNSRNAEQIFNLF